MADEAIVKVKAGCGHYDVYRIAAGEVMTVNEEPFSLCKPCSAESEG